MKFSLLVPVALSLVTAAHPTRRAAFSEKNGQDAISLNSKFKGLKNNSACKDGEIACIEGQFAQCVGGKFALQPCSAGTTCAALPLVNKPGTSIACTTQSDVDARIAATGANTGNSSANASKGSNKKSGKSSSNNNAAGNDPQSSLTLDPAVLAKGFEQNGQEVPEAGQVASSTSKNNFINFCLTVKAPITNGQQIKGGSCNPAPMGVIPSTNNMPSAKFTNPKNGDTIQANKNFTISMAIRGMEAGHFVNADSNYFSAPQELNNNGQIKGHSHVVVEQLDSLDQTTPTNPQKFAFFKGLNGKPDKNGELTAVVANGLPAGVYKLSSINTASNHQPVLVPIAQHGSLDDAVYFTVSDGGKQGGNNGGRQGGNNGGKQGGNNGGKKGGKQ